MSPNVIGSTFILAETAISNTDANNNNNSNSSNNNKSNSKTNIMQSPADKSLSPVATATANSNNLAGASRISGVGTSQELETQQMPFKTQIVWHNVMLFVYLHSSALCGLYLVFADNAYLDLLFSLVLALLSGLGITAGAHRLWSHRTYKARLPLRIFLMLCQSLAFQNSIYEWTRDHRVHHKFTDTNADPHNSKRGFFFAHMGWLMCKKHPDVRGKGKNVDLSDLDADPVVRFQKKYYFVLMPICCFIIPFLFPYYCLGSSVFTSFLVSCMLRYCVILHGTWLVNSAAHFYGMKPYDKSISSSNNIIVSALAFGEGWHNYHHVFPWDYKAAELPYYFNLTTGFLNLMARIGQAYDLKTVSNAMLLRRVRRTGDGSHSSCMDVNNNNTNSNETADITMDVLSKLNHEFESTMVWGWDDKDIHSEDRLGTQIIEKKDE